MRAYEIYYLQLIYNQSQLYSWVVISADTGQISALSMRSGFQKAHYFTGGEAVLQAVGVFGKVSLGIAWDTCIPYWSVGSGPGYPLAIVCFQSHLSLYTLWNITGKDSRIWVAVNYPFMNVPVIKVTDPDCVSSSWPQPSTLSPAASVREVNQCIEGLS